MHLALHFSNLASFLRGGKVKFQVVDSILVASSRDERHFAGTVRRGLQFLTIGLSNRGSALRNQYLLDFVKGPIRTVVDVGANSGDLMLAFPHGLNEYLGVEPIEEEYRALEMNCNLRNFRKPMKVAASNQNSSLEIFVSTAGGDSSAIQPASGFTEKRKVPASTIDSIMTGQGLQGVFNVVDLLKIEAEGFEPEVLEGCIQTLKSCRWVVVDGGPERGTDSQTTIETCTNFLVANGFELQALNISSRPGVGLFRNLSEAM